MLRLDRVLGSSVVFVLSAALRVGRAVLLGVVLAVEVVAGIVVAICFAVVFSILLVNSLLVNGKMVLLSPIRGVVWGSVRVFSEGN